MREQPDRIPYSETLRCLLDASAILALGSNDASYTASKIYPCLLARKPLLVVCHEQSGVVRLLEEAGGGVCATFGGDGAGTAASQVRTRWLEGRAYQEQAPLDRAKFERYLERASARDLARWWQGVATQVT